MTPALHRTFAVIATLSVIGAIAWGFVVVGSPDTRRHQRLDERRLEHLQTIQREIQELVTDEDFPGTLRSPLPATLAELATRAKTRKIESLDAETGAPYVYRVLSDTTYEVCATFALPRNARWEVFWNHPAGSHCFTIDVLDPPP